MRVVVTRAREDARKFIDQLARKGFEPVCFPTIEIVPVPDIDAFNRAFEKLARLDWLIFTSANGVSVFFNRLSKSPFRLSESMKIAAVGEKTAACARAFGHAVNFIPEVFVGENIVSGLGDINGKSILLPGADIADPALPKALITGGADVDVLTAYRTIPADPDRDALAAIREGVDVITFTSGSTAHNFCSLIANHGLDPINLPGSPAIACIGPTTTAEAAGLGFVVRITADPHSIEGLVSAIVQYRKESNR